MQRAIKDRLIEFVTIFATIMTLLVIIGIPLRSPIIIMGFAIGISYVIISHVTLFFLKIDTNIEEIKNYIKPEDHIRLGETKMNKKGKVNWMIIILTIVLSLILIFVFKNLFNF